MNSQIYAKLCEEHFPEPILYFFDKPLCKKCLPKYLENNKGKNRSLSQNQSIELAKMLGINNMALNAY